MRFLFALPNLISYVALVLLYKTISGDFTAECVETYQFVSGCREYGPGIDGFGTFILGLVLAVIAFIGFCVTLACRTEYTGYLAKLATAKASIDIYKEQIAGIKANIADLKEFNDEILANGDKPVAAQMEALSTAQGKLAEVRAEFEEVRAKKIAYELGPYSSLTTKAERDQFTSEDS